MKFVIICFVICVIATERIEPDIYFVPNKFIESEPTEENELKYDKILQKLEDQGLLKYVTQLLNAFDFVNVMLANKKFHRRAFGCLKNHLNRDHIAEFSHEFDCESASGKVMMLDCFKIYCAHHGNCEDRTPIQCSAFFMQRDTEKCKTQLQKFVQTLQPGVIKSFPRDVNNFLEYPSHETVIFNIEVCNTKKLLEGKKLTWKYKLFPIMISYQREDFVLQFGIDRKQRHGNGILLRYANTSGAIKIDFDEINFSNPPTFLIRSAVFKNSDGSEQILAAKAMLFLFRGLWCDVKQLEQCTRIEEIKTCLIPYNRFRTVLDRSHNKITFPQDGVLEYKLILSSNSEEIFSLVWKQDKFPLIIKHEGQGFVFACIHASSRDKKYQKWEYVDALKRPANREHSETIIIYFPRDSQYPIEQHELGDLAVKAKCISLTLDEGIEKKIVKRISAVKVLNEGFWCDIKLIKKAVEEFFDNNQ